jgi:hypothetical protein
MAFGRITMKKWPILLVVLCLGLLGQDRRSEYGLVPFRSANTEFRMAGHIVEKRGSVEIWHNALIETKVLTITADELEHDHATGEIELRGNVRVKLFK